MKHEPFKDRTLEIVRDSYTESKQFKQALTASLDQRFVNARMSQLVDKEQTDLDIKKIKTVLAGGPYLYPQGVCKEYNQPIITDTSLSVQETKET